jgi:hypothetical protein
VSSVEQTQEAVRQGFALLWKVQKVSISLIANPVTLYHQTETIAAVNARIPSGHVLNDATVASVLLLVITGSLQKDNGATEAHRRGLLRIVSVRGGLEKLGFDGFLARMIQM